MRSALFGLLVLIAWPLPSWSENGGLMTGGEFLELCRAKETDRIGACEMVLYTLAVTHEVDLSDGTSKKKFCTPPAAGAADLRTVVVDRLTKSPEFLEKPFVTTAFVALIRAYPCP